MPFRPAITVDGATASEAEIQAAYESILRFQDQLRSYRACLDLKMAEAEAARDEKALADLTRRFNESVDAEKEVVTAFNRELAEFRERKP